MIRMKRRQDGLPLLRSDNDFEILPPDIRHLVNLRILALRGNELIEIPAEIGELTNLRELHLQVCTKLLLCKGSRV